MKVRVPKTECALLFGAVPVEVEEKLNSLSMPVRRIADEDWGQKIGFCAGVPGYERSEAVAVEPLEDDAKMLVLQASDRRLDRVLQQLRGLPTGPKAVVTPHNINWTGEELYRELLREREAMKRRISERLGEK